MCTCTHVPLGPRAQRWALADTDHWFPQQIQLVNTNTRYLHPLHIKLAEELLATMPSPLSEGNVFFVNSGSEANDLALRLARAHTGNKVCFMKGSILVHNIALSAIVV